MTATLRPGSSKGKAPNRSSRSSNGAANGAHSGASDLSTIQSILIGDFSAATSEQITALQQSLDTLRTDLQDRISGLEAELDSERGQRQAAVMALQEATQADSQAHTQALGRVKADITRGRKAMRSSLDETRAASVDRETFGAALRSLASLVDGQPVDTSEAPGSSD